MSTLLIEIRYAEKYLSGKMSAEDALVFEAKLLTNPVLKMNVYFLEKTFHLLKLYHRRRLKEEAQAAHQRLFSDPNKAEFSGHIFQLFKR
jgi:hypothetical protein